MNSKIGGTEREVMQCHVSLHVIAVRCSVFKKKKNKNLPFSQRTR